MLTMVTAKNPQGDSLYLPLMDASNGYVVKEIQGLDPVKATLVSSSLAQVDGAQFQHARREPRNITMRLGLEPDYVVTSVAGLRSGLYDYFMPKLPIQLKFDVDSTAFAVTDGIVESMENNMFSADPEVDISVICYDPDMLAPAPVTFNGSTTSGVNNSDIEYDGTSDAGAKFTLVLNRTASEICLYNTRPDNIAQLCRIAGSFLSGDQIVINSVPGQKSVSLTRSGLTTSILYYLDPGSTWISLAKGTNAFRAYLAGTALSYTLEYTPRYGGI